jgi:vacuolar-type H+-ATPase subunit I/STV1
VTSQTFIKLLDESVKISTSTRAYFEALARANPETVAEVAKMGAASYEAVLEELGLVHQSVLENEIKTRDEQIKTLDEQIKTLDEQIKTREEQIKHLADENRKRDEQLINLYDESNKRSNAMNKFVARLLTEGVVDFTKIYELMSEITLPSKTSQ